MHTVFCKPKNYFILKAPFITILLITTINIFPFIINVFLTYNGFLETLQHLNLIDQAVIYNTASYIL